MRAQKLKEEEEEKAREAEQIKLEAEVRKILLNFL